MSRVWAILAHRLQALGQKLKDVKYVGFLPLENSRTYQEMTSYRKTKKKKRKWGELKTTGNETRSFWEEVMADSTVGEAENTRRWRLTLWNVIPTTEYIQHMCPHFSKWQSNTYFLRLKWYLDDIMQENDLVQGLVYSEGSVMLTVIWIMINGGHRLFTWTWKC